MGNKPQKEKSNMIYISKGTYKRARCLGEKENVTIVTIIENFYSNIMRQYVKE